MITGDAVCRFRNNLGCDTFCLKDTTSDVSIAAATPAEEIFNRTYLNRERIY